MLVFEYLVLYNKVITTRLVPNHALLGQLSYYLLRAFNCPGPLQVDLGIKVDGVIMFSSHVLFSKTATFLCYKGGDC